jgi:hypothetical protein
MIGMLEIGGKEGVFCCVDSKVGYCDTTLEGIVENVGLDDIEGTFVLVGNAVSLLSGTSVNWFFGVSLGDCGTDEGTIEGIVDTRHDLAAL